MSGAPVNVLFTSVGRRVELVRAFRGAYAELGLEGRILGVDVDPLAPALGECDEVFMVPRIDEPRKGMDVLVGALSRLVPERPDLRLLVAGRGEAEEFLDGVPAVLRDRIDLMGQVSEHDKARMLTSVDVYCAPNTGQESFGVILLEAMAAQTPIVASELEAFRRVLDGGAAPGWGTLRRAASFSPGVVFPGGRDG